MDRNVRFQAQDQAFQLCSCPDTFTDPLGCCLEHTLDKKSVINTPCLHTLYCDRGYTNEKN